MSNLSLKEALAYYWQHIIAKCDDILSQAKNFTTETVSSLSNTLTSHINSTSNPHAVTKSQVGLGKVDNTADANKPVSEAQQIAIDKVSTRLTETAAAINNEIDELVEQLDNYLPLSAGENYPITGPLGLTNNVGYGENLPETGFEGQIFFVEENTADLLHRQVISTALNYNNWSSSVPYTQTISVASITSDSLPHITINYDSTLSTAKDQRTNFGYVSDVSCSDGTITFKCFDNKPAINLPIIIEFFY